MSDGKPKPSIPAWQRAAPPPPPPPSQSAPPPSAQDDPVSSQAETQEADAAQAVSGTDVPEPSEATVQEDATNLEEEQTKPPAFQTREFEAFKQRQQPQPSPPQTQAPPIITYPEFLIEAHKPPPLITPATVITSLYIAGGVAAALYGASKYLVTPMLEGLTVSRHDVMAHSQSKIDEFNERLSKIVSKVPESNKGGASSNSSDVSDAESDTSDPTELYHRDMGTQTSPPPSRPSSPFDATPEKDDDAVEIQRLAILRDHIEQLVKGSERTGESHKERQESMSKLRLYLDGLQYASSGINVWASEDNTNIHINDSVEDLKKEIRGVKGVLLSAKRFPALSRAVPGAS